MERYSTNLTDKQWQVIKIIIKPQERKRKHSLRNIKNAILYLLKTGCQWLIIPKDFAPWESVICESTILTLHYSFQHWLDPRILINEPNHLPKIIPEVQ